MDITSATSALIPVKTSIQPLTAVEEKYVSHFRYNNNNYHDRLVYIGYGPDGTDGKYAPSGRKLEDHSGTGSIIDMYV